MDFNTLIAFCALLLTIIGWGVAYLFSKKRDEANKRKEIRVSYLIDAWRLLESASNRDDNSLNKNIEIAIADIQLFGNHKQIELAQKLADEISKMRRADPLELLIELRTSLREELKLEKTSNVFKFLRFK